MSLTLYSTLGNLRAAKIVILAEHLKVELQFKTIDYAQMKTSEYLAKHPLGKVPLLETPEGPIYESNAILRYLARKQKALYGSNTFEVGQIDQWLDFNNSEIDPLTITLLSQCGGWAPLNKDLYNEARKGLKEAVKVLENHLKGKKFLVGESVSIADITIASVLSLSFRLFFDEKTRQTISNVTEWYKNVSSIPAFQSVLGKAWLCEKEYELHFPEEAKHVEAKKEKKDEEKKEEKKDVRKDAGKKEEKK
jgi:elongation factor 1-gamma